LLVSSLCELETANTFRLQVFRKQVSLQEAQTSLQDLDLHLRQDLLHRCHLPEASFSRAHQFSEQYATSLGTRGADVLHVAAAVELGASGFFSFDMQQRDLAVAVGLTVNPLP
jgi:hypothetical protein